MPFAIHKGLLREQSPWFADKLGNDELELHLAHVPPRTFRLFTAWLYAGKLVHPDVALPDDTAQMDDKDDTEDEEPTWQDIDLTHLYTFAHAHRVRRLCNDILTTIHHSHSSTKRLTTEPAIRFLWESCGASSALSRFVLQERALYGMKSRDNVPAYFQTMPPNFLAGVIKAAASLHSHRSGGHTIAALPSACHWHDHGNDLEEKVRCRQRLANTQTQPHTYRGNSSRPSTAVSSFGSGGTHFSMASTAVLSRSSDAWKYDSVWFHPLYIAPEYPTGGPPAYTLKDAALPASGEGRKKGAVF
ncbi:hypothetical protein LTR08_003945 [Meristemomyces frigidus]|nr:hypothetical protein LTR08_003945 [Meristemomyces frigidus]